MLILFRVGSSHIINPRHQSDVNCLTNTLRVCKDRPRPALRTRPGQLSIWNPTERQGDINGVRVRSRAVKIPRRVVLAG